MKIKVLIYGLFFIFLMVLYQLGIGTVFVDDGAFMFGAVILVSLILYYYIDQARKGESIYLRPIAGLKAIEENKVDLKKLVEIHEILY